MLYSTGPYGLGRAAPIYESLLPRLLIIVHGALLFFLTALVITTLIVRSPASRTYMYRLVTSLSLYSLATLLDLVHYSLIATEQLDFAGSSYNILAVFSVILVQASWLVMLVCILDVLHNRLLAVWPNWRKGWIIGHAAVAGGMGALAVCELAVTANWVEWTRKEKTREGYQEVQGSTDNPWHTGVDFARAQEIIHLMVIVYILCASAVGGWFSRKKGLFSHNLFTLTFTAVLLLLPRIFALVEDYYTVFGQVQFDPVTEEASMKWTMNNFLAENVPLLFAYAGLVVIGKRRDEFVGEGKGTGRVVAEGYGQGAARGFYPNDGQV